MSRLKTALATLGVREDNIQKLAAGVALPEYGKWLAVAEDGEDPRPREQIP
jgi:hypothetical protein